MDHDLKDDIAEIKLSLRDLTGHVRDLKEDVTGVRTVLSGPSAEPHKGVIVRLDRVEQKHETASKWFWVLLPVTLATAIKAAWDGLRGGH